MPALDTAPTTSQTSDNPLESGLQKLLSPHYGATTSPVLATIMMKALLSLKQAINDLILKRKTDPHSKIVIPSDIAETVTIDKTKYELSTVMDAVNKNKKNSTLWNSLTEKEKTALAVLQEIEAFGKAEKRETEEEPTTPSTTRAPTTTLILDEDPKESLRAAIGKILNGQKWWTELVAYVKNNNRLAAQMLMDRVEGAAKLMNKKGTWDTIGLKEVTQKFSDSLQPFMIKDAPLFITMIQEATGLSPKTEPKLTALNGPESRALYNWTYTIKRLIAFIEYEEIFKSEALQKFVAQVETKKIVSEEPPVTPTTAAPTKPVSEQEALEQALSKVIKLSYSDAGRYTGAEVVGKLQSLKFSANNIAKGYTTEIPAYQLQPIVLSYFPDTKVSTDVMLEAIKDRYDEPGLLSPGLQAQVKKFLDECDATMKIVKPFMKPTAVPAQAEATTTSSTWSASPSSTETKSRASTDIPTPSSTTSSLSAPVFTEKQLNQTMKLYDEERDTGLRKVLIEYYRGDTKAAKETLDWMVNRMEVLQNEYVMRSDWKDRSRKFTHSMLKSDLADLITLHNNPFKIDLPLSSAMSTVKSLTARNKTLTPGEREKVELLLAQYDNVIKILKDAKLVDTQGNLLPE